MSRKHEHSKVFGYNTDVPSAGTVYHVQTEDRGEKNPVIDSVIYVKGQIVERRRTPYVPGQNSVEQLQQMVKKQHGELVDSIRAGTFVPHGQEAAEPGGTVEPFSVELLNAQSLERDGRLIFRLRLPSGTRVRGQLDVAGAEAETVEATASQDGQAELTFGLPQGPATVLFRAGAGNAARMLKFEVRRQ